MYTCVQNYKATYQQGWSPTNQARRTPKKGVGPKTNKAKQAIRGCCKMHTPKVQQNIHKPWLKKSKSDQFIRIDVVENLVHHVLDLCYNIIFSLCNIIEATSIPSNAKPNKSSHRKTSELFFI
ncbi:unnamed protein product [Cuscuta europaea]|uniref:Uncharacterized protein n=1 Tax=Cuscuta europaea TaxID=41803 RepID=A0A9P1E037_CUSEU|nr:unnamed protein product [Cuscuta europaea]